MTIRTVTDGPAGEPAITSVEVAKLFGDALLIEIEAVAAVQRH